MWYRKCKGFRYLAGLVMGVGLAAGMVVLPVMPVRAATQVSSATKTSAVPTLSDDDFKAQLNAPVDNTNQPIGDVIKDPQLAQAVANGLNADYFGGTKANLQKMIELNKDQKYNTALIITPSPNQAPGTPTVSDWTGLSAVANMFGAIQVDDQPDFNTKAAILVKHVGATGFGIDLTFQHDDMTTAGFNALADLLGSDIYFNSLIVEYNQIKDFSAINKFPNSGSNAPVNGMKEAGSTEESSALMVHGSSVLIKGGVPGAELLPGTLLTNRRTGVFRFETAAQTSSYLNESASANVSTAPGENVDSPVTFSKLNALNQVNFSNTQGKWENFFPWTHANYGDNPDFSAISPSDLADLAQMTITGIPDNVNALMIRSIWANGASGSAYPISTLVKIPLIHENSQSNLPETSTTSSETTSSQTSNPSQPTGPNIAKKGQAVYALKKIGLYRQPTFTKQNQRYFYQRQPRIRRPQFVVTGYAYSKQGLLRYRVRDVNHHSATANRQGYITAQSGYVVKTYYQAAPKKIRVISPHGINAYRKANLTGRVKHYRQGQVLRVKKIKTYHLTTRLILTNGQYITANKTLVQKK